MAWNEGDIKARLASVGAHIAAQMAETCKVCDGPFWSAGRMLGEPVCLPCQTVVIWSTPVGLLDGLRGEAARQVIEPQKVMR